jgi:hypothetical protein
MIERMVRIGDMTLQDVDDMTRTLQEDLERERRELARFAEAQRLVVPVMLEHPGWTWGDACRHLETIGIIAEAKVRRATDEQTLRRFDERQQFPEGEDDGGEPYPPEPF